MRRALAAAALAALTAAGCGDGSMNTQGDGGADATTDAPAACPPTSRTLTFVMARMAIVRTAPMMDEVAEGFDLDDRVSPIGESATCRQADLTSPSGERGIDNQLARLVPLVDQMTGGALDGAIQGAINNGQMLVTVTVDGVDDMCNDPAVDVQLRRVSGMPFVGSDMLVDPGQTFDVMRDTPSARTTGRIVNGVLETDPANLPLPIAILDARFVLNFYDARLRLAINTNGDGAGLIGGGISLAEFTSVVEDLTIPSALMMTVKGALALYADLDRNAMGKCERISGAMRLMARPAFVLE